MCINTNISERDMDQMRAVEGLMVSCITSGFECIAMEVKEDKRIGLTDYEFQ